MRSARSTTLPIMMIAGDFIFSRFTFDAMFETVPEIILWRAVVPSCMTATGVFLSMPPDKSCLQITPIRARPIIITIVSHAFAMRFHLIDSVRFDGSSCPVTKTTDEECKKMHVKETRVSNVHTIEGLASMITGKI